MKNSEKQTNKAKKFNDIQVYKNQKGKFNFGEIKFNLNNKLGHGKSFPEKCLSIISILFRGNPLGI